MTPGLSLVCSRCQRASDLLARTCSGCGEPLYLLEPSGDSPFANDPDAVFEPGAQTVRDPSTAMHAHEPARPSSPSAPKPPVPQKPKPKEPRIMAKDGGRTCTSCGSEVPAEYRFCGRCGTRVEDAPAPQGGRTMFFGAMQVPGKAKLILIKGEGLDGVSYHLNATEHLAGRTQGVILFPEDPLMSPAHATFFYQDARLYLRDEGSVNGVFIRIREPFELEAGDHFLVGEQLIRFDLCDDAGPAADETGTYFYASPKRPSAFKLTQVLRGGEMGLSYRARGEVVTLGREGNDIDFPTDQFISGRHAQVHAAGPRFLLSDLGSKNGTFIRLRRDRALVHGDYVFIGQQLLRVEIT